MLNSETIINDYIEAYNRFDIEGMTANFDEYIHFENISNGIVNMVLDGLPAFNQQAQRAKDIFSQREQVITSLQHRGNETEVNIDYTGTLAADLSSELKKGDKLRLSGKSIFTFADEKIIRLVDIS